MSQTYNQALLRHLNILAISGSLRATSSNTAALQALRQLASETVSIHLYQQLGDLPHFNPDLENATSDLPAPVRDLRTQIGHADGIIISSPEYAHGVPGVLKNALDWLVGSFEFPGKAVALLNIAPHSTYVQVALSEILRTMSAKLIDEPTFTFAIPRDRLSLAAMLADPVVSQALQRAGDVFVQAVRLLPPREE